MSSAAARRAAPEAGTVPSLLPSPGAARQKAWRARRRNGAAVYPVQADAAALNFLIDLGWLSATESADRREVGRAIAALIEDAARRHKIP
jgi:hypothetical protein